MQRAIEVRDTREHGAALGVLHKQPPQHRCLVGHPGMHDRIVDVGDHYETRLRRRDVDLGLRRHPRRREHRNLERMPPHVGGRGRAGFHFDAEVAVLIGLGFGTFRGGTVAAAPAWIAYVTQLQHNRFYPGT